MNIPTFIEFPATRDTSGARIATCVKEASSFVSLMKPLRRDCGSTQPPLQLTSLERWSSEGSSSRRGEAQKTQTSPRLPRRKRASTKNDEFLWDNGKEECWELTPSSSKYQEEPRRLPRHKSEGAISSNALRDQHARRFHQRDGTFEGSNLRFSRRAPPRQPQRSSSARGLVLEQSSCSVAVARRRSDSATTGRSG